MIVHGLLHTYVNRAFIGLMQRKCNIDRCPIRAIIVFITCKQITAKQKGEREIQSEREREREGGREREEERAKERAERERETTIETGRERERASERAKANRLQRPQQYWRARHCHMARAALTQRSCRIASHVPRITVQRTHCDSVWACREQRSDLSTLLLANVLLF